MVREYKYKMAHDSRIVQGSAAATQFSLAPLRLAPAYPNWDKQSGARL